jgi:hypothetical protein
MKASKIDPYWLHTHEDEHYIDYKVSREDFRFPNHDGEKLNGEVITYSIDELDRK